MNFKKKNKNTEAKVSHNTVFEKIMLFGALFCFAFGMGLFMDGKKIHAHQLKISERVDYRATLASYSIR